MLNALDDVPTFVAVVEAGGFSAAARRLNLSRSAVGKVVARLEHRLGARLFHRTTRSLSLTDDGQAFYKRCQRALAELREGRALLESGRKTASGRLRVSMPVLFGRLCVVPVLLRLATDHPELELELDFGDRLVDVVEDGFDVVVRNGALGGGFGLMVRRIAQERTVICASPAYVERRGLPNGLDDLLQHQAITYCRNGRVRPWLFPREGKAPQEVAPLTRLRFDDLGAMLDATTAGHGLAWLPDWLVGDRLLSGELVRVLPEAPVLITPVHAMWPQTPHLPLRVRVAIDALAAAADEREAT